MTVLSALMRAFVEGVILYVTYYGFCGFWYVLLTPYAGPS